jgi:2-(1,2-epoxy-1,2-dihydrophenyl)acetyl-CoA isomerase
MEYDRIRYSLADRVARISLDQPATLNALSPEMGNQLRHAFERAEGEARAVVLGGIGRAFCSGTNIGDIADAIGAPEFDAGAILEHVYNPIIRDMRALKLPIVAAVRGVAAGIGCALACASDLVVAGESAYFFQAFCKIGLVPDGGSAWLLARAIGRARAMDMMLLGTRVPAPQALDWGLVNRVTNDDEVDNSAFEIARGLAEGAGAVAMIKASAWDALEASLDERLDAERVLQRDMGRSRDFLEGVSAFLEKRNPVFLA